MSKAIKNMKTIKVDQSNGSSSLLHTAHCSLYTSSRPNPVSGFTLVELLVVIAIIGILIGLLLPAVQSVREAARNMQCKNNMKQMALAALNHEGVQKRLPTGGWGYDWIGNPSYGFGASQPGGFFYSILPFMEQNALFDYDTSDDTKAKAGATLLIQTPVSAFYCPSRRGAQTYKNDQPSASWGSPKFGGTSKSGRVNQVQAVARCDYAGNAGNGPSLSNSGPGSYSSSYNYTGYGTASATGVVYIQSATRLSAITDGLSHTALTVEKFIAPKYYESGLDGGDNQSAYTGGDVDVIRYMGCLKTLTSSDTKETFSTTAVLRPAHDTDSYPCHASWWWAIGSAHSSAMNVALCDGSVTSIDYGIDPFVYCALGNRKDSQPMDDEQ